jgi:WD40 repeat protein
LGYTDKTIRLIDLTTGQEQHTYSIADGAPWLISRHIKYTIISSNGEAELWDLTTGSAVMTATSTAGLSAAVVSADEAYAAVGFQDGSIQIWKTGTGQVVATLHGHANGINALDFTRDDKYLLSGSQDKTARLWNVENGQQLRQWSSNARDVSAALLSPDGRFVVAGSLDGSL